MKSRASEMSSILIFLCVMLNWTAASTQEQQEWISREEAIAAMNYGAKNPTKIFGARVEDKRGCWTCPGKVSEVVAVAYIYAPRDWIAMQSAQFAKQYDTMKPEHLNDEMLRKIVRILAPSKAPGDIGKIGPYMSGSHKEKIIAGYSVTRLVLTNKEKSTILKPLKETLITEESQNLMGAKFEMTGMLSEFDINEVRKFAASEKEIYVTIVKTVGDEGRCKVKSKDLLGWLQDLKR